LNKRLRPITMAGLGAVMTLSLFVAAGCGKKEDAAGPPTDGPGGTSVGMRRGGPGGMGRGPGGRGGPVAADASGSDIYQQKCQGCHGNQGAGGKAPVLTSASGKSDDDLVKIIHDGKEKMPAFASQLTDDQIKKVVATIKGFGSAK
jgi:mono/diheme cytochrome c family protein